MNRSVSKLSPSLALSLSGFLLSGCGDSRETELLQRENELLKREKALLEQQGVAAGAPAPAPIAAPPAPAPAPAAPVRKEEVETAFLRQRSAIEGPERDCWPVATAVGDLDGDGDSDSVLQYGCGLKGNEGNASAGGGLAFFLNDGVTLGFAGLDLSNSGFVLETVDSGQVRGSVLTYADGDPSCCPSLSRPVSFRLADRKLETPSGASEKK